MSRLDDHPVVERRERRHQGLEACPGGLDIGVRVPGPLGERGQDAGELRMDQHGSLHINDTVSIEL
jgi:hypothetical protein